MYRDAVRSSLMRYQAFFYVLLLSFLYGSTLVVSRFSVGQYDPRTYISLRLVLATVGYVGVFLLSPARRWPRDPNLWGRAMILGLIGTAVPMTSMVSSLQYQSSGVTALLITMSPVVTVILAHLFLHDERLTGRKALGVIVAFAGAGLLLVRGETGLADFAQADWRGYAWAGVGILASGGAAVYARRYLRDEDMWDVSSVRMATAAAALIPVTALTVGYDLSRVDAAGYAGLLYASIAGTFCGMWLNFFIIKRFGATPASQTAYVMPVITTTLGALVLGERVTAFMVIGMLIIFTGITLLNWGLRRRTPARTVVPGGNPISTGKA